jgi:hypothetical protein
MTEGISALTGSTPSQRNYSFKYTMIKIRNALKAVWIWIKETCAWLVGHRSSQKPFRAAEKISKSILEPILAKESTIQLQEVRVPKAAISSLCAIKDQYLDTIVAQSHAQSIFEMVTHALKKCEEYCPILYNVTLESMAEVILEETLCVDQFIFADLDKQEIKQLVEPLKTICDQNTLFQEITSHTILGINKEDYEIVESIIAWFKNPQIGKNAIREAIKKARFPDKSYIFHKKEQTDLINEVLNNQVKNILRFCYKKLVIKKTVPAITGILQGLLVPNDNKPSLLQIIKEDVKRITTIPVQNMETLLGNIDLKKLLDERLFPDIDLYLKGSLSSPTLDSKAIASKLTTYLFTDLRHEGEESNQQIERFLKEKLESINLSTHFQQITSAVANSSGATVNFTETLKEKLTKLSQGSASQNLYTLIREQTEKAITKELDKAKECIDEQFLTHSLLPLLQDLILLGHAKTFLKDWIVQSDDNMKAIFNLCKNHVPLSEDKLNEIYSALDSQSDASKAIVNKALQEEIEKIKKATPDDFTKENAFMEALPLLANLDALHITLETEVKNLWDQSKQFKDNLLQALNEKNLAQFPVGEYAQKIRTKSNAYKKDKDAKTIANVQRFLELSLENYLEALQCSMPDDHTKQEAFVAAYINKNFDCELYGEIAENLLLTHGEAGFFANRGKGAIKRALNPLILSALSSMRTDKNANKIVADLITEGLKNLLFKTEQARASDTDIDIEIKKTAQRAFEALAYSSKKLSWVERIGIDFVVNKPEHIETILRNIFNKIRKSNMKTRNADLMGSLMGRVVTALDEAKTTYRASLQGRRVVAV